MKQKAREAAKRCTGGRARTTTLHVAVTLTPEELRALHDAIFPKTYVTIKAPRLTKRDLSVLRGLMNRRPKSGGD